MIETAQLVVELGGVEEKNTELGLQIDALTPVAKWGEEPCRYDVAVEYLLRKNHPDVRAEKLPAETDPELLELQFKLEDLERQDHEARLARAYAD